jgi:hypothetical protein
MYLCVSSALSVSCIFILVVVPSGFNRSTIEFRVNTRNQLNIITL